VLHEALATNKLLASTFQNVSLRWLLANGDHLAIRIMLWMVALNLNFFDILEYLIVNSSIFTQISRWVKKELQHELPHF
jgi:hypothetical protein